MSRCQSFDKVVVERGNEVSILLPQRDAVRKLEIGASNDAEASGGVARPVNGVGDLVEVGVEVGKALGPGREVVGAGEEVPLLAVASGVSNYQVVEAIIRVA